MIALEFLSEEGACIFKKWILKCSYNNILELQWWASRKLAEPTAGIWTRDRSSHQWERDYARLSGKLLSHSATRSWAGISPQVCLIPAPHSWPLRMWVFDRAATSELLEELLKHTHLNILLKKKLFWPLLKEDFIQDCCSRAEKWGSIANMAKKAGDL